MYPSFNSINIHNIPFSYMHKNIHLLTRILKQLIWDMMFKFVQCTRLSLHW